MFGELAREYGSMYFLLRVCKSAAGYYIGTVDEDGLPFTRESEEYWSTWTEANNALKSKTFTQRSNP